MREAKKLNGVCKLTGETGAFINSHLIPRSVTKPESPGAPFIQFGHGGPPTKRYSSWTDRNLVTRAGEDILTEYDSWAIPVLRKHQLVWSGWQNSHLNVQDWDRLPNSNYGVRTIEGIDTARLRLFFLTLLWRAAATTRPEFSAVDLPPPDIEALATMIKLKRADPISFYPVELIQLSTMGTVQNHVPIRQIKEVPSVEKFLGRQVPIFRFYFDGLVAHIHRRPFDDEFIKGLGPLLLGSEDKIVLSTVPYETSFQKAVLTDLQAEVARNYPEFLTKFR